MRIHLYAVRINEDPFTFVIAFLLTKIEKVLRVVKNFIFFMKRKSCEIFIDVEIRLT